MAGWAPRERKALFWRGRSIGGLRGVPSALRGKARDRRKGVDGWRAILT